MIEFISCVLISAVAFAEINPQQLAMPPAKTRSPLKVKTVSRSENFDSQLVEGQVYRPDLSVVTGDTDNNGFGVLRLRNNFDDHAKNDQGELIK